MNDSKNEPSTEEKRTTTTAEELLLLGVVPLRYPTELERVEYVKEWRLAIERHNQEKESTDEK